MQGTDCSAEIIRTGCPDAAATIVALQSAFDQVQAENTSLRQQLAWFKRQLFGRKSEKRLIESPDQLDLRVLLGDTPPLSEPAPTEEITYRRQRKQRGEDCVTDSGLRWNISPHLLLPVKEAGSAQLHKPARIKTSQNTSRFSQVECQQFLQCLEEAA